MSSTKIEGKSSLLMIRRKFLYITSTNSSPNSRKHKGACYKFVVFNPLNAELNIICHFLALLGGATIVVVSRLRVKQITTCCSESDVKHKNVL